MDTKLTPVIAHLGKVATSLAPSFELAAPTTASILLETGQYKSQRFAGGEEFFFTGCRAGKKDLILEFKPVDARDFEQMELPLAKVFTAFPKLEPYLADALAQNDGLSFDDAVSVFLEAETKRAARSAEEAEAAKYGANPNWGMF